MSGPPNPESMKAGQIANWWMENDPGMWDRYLLDDPEALAAVDPSFAASARARRRAPA
jgi:hypothetical protein